jgi:Rrf2 family protein
MKLFSKASEYAILVLLRAIETDSLHRFSPADICSGQGIPVSFARKALVDLAKAHILEGTRGPGGGYRLLPDPAEVTLLDIVKAVDGDYILGECPLGVRCAPEQDESGEWICPSCSPTNPHCGLGHLCPLHDLWHNVRHLVIERLSSATLASIGERLEQPQSPIASAARGPA